MKSLFSFVEGLKIGSYTNIRKQIFTDDELRKDYKDVEYAITKAEKQKYANKYRLNTNRFRDIQVAILDHLRNNRNNKDEFDYNDVIDFIRYNVPERQYTEYLDKEPTEFIEYMLSCYEKKGRKINPARCSIADKSILRKIDKLKKYLHK